MARVGVSYPRYAKYANSGSTVTYSDGGSMGKAISVSLELESSGKNILYADNAAAESSSTFSGGTLTVGTDDLRDDAALAILGIQAEDGTETSDPKELVYSASDNAPYVGVGFIMKHIIGGATKWTGVILTKVQFSVPGLDLTTQGEEIEWQTPEIEGTVMRDDTTGSVWRRQKTFDTEAAAQSYIDTFLSITPAA